jgi:high-affinity K+ transport system ATPase subunit B
MQRAKTPQLIPLRLLLAIMVIILLMPASALAYLDPTTGSMLISAIVGLFASLVLAIKTYWYRIKAFFKSKPVDNSTNDDSA